MFVPGGGEGGGGGGGGGGGQFCDSADEDEFKGPYKKDDKVQGNLKSQLIELN